MNRFTDGFLDIVLILFAWKIMYDYSCPFYVVKLIVGMCMRGVKFY